MYNIFLDDIRKPSDVTWIELPPYSWVIVRSYAEFIETILTRGLPITVSFDNDLHPTHYQFYKSMSEDGRTRYPYEQCLVKTGYHCAQWLVKYCLDRKLNLPYYIIHTFNPVAREDISALLKSYERRPRI